MSNRSDWRKNTQEALTSTRNSLETRDTQTSRGGASNVHCGGAGVVLVFLGKWILTKAAWALRIRGYDFGTRLLDVVRGAWLSAVGAGCGAQGTDGDVCRVASVGAGICCGWGGGCRGGASCCASSSGSGCAGVDAGTFVLGLFRGLRAVCCRD